MVQKFAQAYANQIRRRRPKPADKWHLDEVVLTIKGQQYYLWRAVDAKGQVLDILMQRHRDKRAAKKFFRKLLKPTGFAPRVIVTDKLRSYGAAKKELIPGVEHRQHKGLKNRAENSHRPTRTRERRMGRFKSPGQAQRFLSAFEPIRGYFHPHQHRQSAAEYRETMRQRLSEWRHSRGYLQSPKALSKTTDRNLVSNAKNGQQFSFWIFQASWGQNLVYRARFSTGK